jgi:hypothetical protein
LSKQLKATIKIVPFTYSGNNTQSGSHMSTGDAYSSYAPDPTSDIFRGPCLPILWFVFPTGLVKCNTNYKYDSNFYAPDAYFDYLGLFCDAQTKNVGNPNKFWSRKKAENTNRIP